MNFINDHDEITSDDENCLRNELVKTCQRIIRIININVLNKDASAQTKAFFIALVGKYYKYIAQNVSGTELDKVKLAAQITFSDSKNINLSP